jgi:hypothetical protein
MVIVTELLFFLSSYVVELAQLWDNNLNELRKLIYKNVMALKKFKFDVININY